MLWKSLAPRTFTKPTLLKKTIDFLEENVLFTCANSILTLQIFMIGREAHFHRTTRPPHCRFINLWHSLWFWFILQECQGMELAPFISQIMWLVDIWIFKISRISLKWFIWVKCLRCPPSVKAADSELYDKIRNANIFHSAYFKKICPFVFLAFWSTN